MKKDFLVWSHETQEFLLRLFIEPSSYSSFSDSQFYTSTRCGTHERLHQ